MLRAISMSVKSLLNTNRGKWLSTVGTSYAYIFSVVICTGITIPLALKFLGKEQYGLWAVSSQLLSYLLLFDGGLSRSLQRLVAESVADPENRGHSRQFNVLCELSILGSLFLFGLAWLVSGWGLRFLSVPTHLLGIGQEVFLSVVVLQCLGYLLGPISAVLYAQNRTYISTSISLVTIWVNTAAFCFFLWHGFGLFSYVCANFLTFPIGSSINLFYFLRSKQRPRLFWVWPTRAELKEVFSFSGNIFLFSMVSETLMAVPTLIITKFSGLEAMAIFFVSFRPAFFLHRFTVQPFGAIFPRWQQLFVTENWEKLGMELETGLLLMFQFGLTVAVCFVACWKPFLMIWVGEKMYGGALLSSTLGIFLIVYLIGGTLWPPFFWAKKITTLNIVQAFELIFTLPTCYFAAKYVNPAAVLLASVLINLIFTEQYCWKAGAPIVGLKDGYGPGLSQHWATLTIHLSFILLAMVWVWIADAMHFSFAILVLGGALISLANGTYFLKTTWKTARSYLKRRAS